MTLKQKKQMTRTSRRAFTVVEVMIASSILIISVLAVTSAFSYARRTVSRTENRLACLHIAREVMETLRGESYDSKILNEGANKRPIPKRPFEDSTYYPIERGYYTITDHVSAEDGARKEITVVIEWKEPADANKTRSVSLKTLHSKGLHR